MRNAAWMQPPELRLFTSLNDNGYAFGFRIGNAGEISWFSGWKMQLGRHF